MSDRVPMRPGCVCDVCGRQLYEDDYWMLSGPGGSYPPLCHLHSELKFWQDKRAAFLAAATMHRAELAKIVAQYGKDDPRHDEALEALAKFEGVALAINALPPEDAAVLMGGKYVF